MEQELFNALEKLCEEKAVICSGREYKLGKNILRYGSNLLHLRFDRLINDYKDKKATNLIEKKLSDNLFTKEKVEYFGTEVKKRIAVYTCITGSYDCIQVPLISFENVDYYILTDQQDQYSKYKGKYRFIQLPDNILEKGRIVANRYAKFHPREYFRNYDYSIYMDGNIRVISDIRKFVTKCDKKTGIAMHKHRERSCAYQEAKVCQMLRRGDTEKISLQMRNYKKEGFPTKFGLNEATVIACDLKNDISINLLEKW